MQGVGGMSGVGEWVRGGGGEGSGFANRSFSGGLAQGSGFANRSFSGGLAQGLEHKVKYPLRSVLARLHDCTIA
ncbi:MAG: hypothetical protein JXA55_00760 [Bacteroidales bacterium]|nr:hypothetical protein [Bacteroidales bacterium]